MGQPLEFNQIFYNEVIYSIEQDWKRRLNEHERNLAILAYRYGRTARVAKGLQLEAENLALAQENARLKDLLEQNNIPVG